MGDGGLIGRYDLSARGWTEKLARIGYVTAYRDFLRACGPDLKRGARICDMGCGSGVFAQAAIGKTGKAVDLTLVDPSAKMLEQASLALRTKVATLSCHQLFLEQFEPRHRFDLMLGAHVIEHCRNPQAALGKMYECLAPGGQMLLVISRPHWCQWLIWLRWRHRWYASEQIDRLARSAGLPAAEHHQFVAGPPSRTSFGYCFKRPKESS